MKSVVPYKQEFSELILPHVDALRRFSLSMTKNDFDADDLVSETVMKAFENFTKLKDKNRVKPWLFTILRNQFISICRRKKTIIGITEEDSFDPDETVYFSLFEAIAKSDFVADGNPEKDFFSRLDQEKINEAIHELPEDFRIALVLCDVEEFSYSEISKITKVPVGTVRSRIARARNILQKKLWSLANEMGIRNAKHPKLRENYTCSCGKEEIEAQGANKISV